MKATLTVLGSGTSMGVPTIGCDCAVCHSSDPHDRRTRPSILLEFGGKTVLIDTTPDFREQAIREGIRKIDAVVYTHAHADHILGIDDLRPLSYHREGKIPLYARPEAADFLRKMFSYIFDADYKFGGLARLELKPIDGPFELFGTRIQPVPVMHGDTEIFAASDTFDRGELDAHRRSGEGQARLLHAYLSRSAARGNQRCVAGACAPVA